ncbi:MAG: SDR family oxidoreductase [Burkholderiales bacterium]|nr:glucose 1-dehydrogenase [Burkholderiales bacterium]MDE1927933.1 SDR family oxidoreductase [Burkholderiales bacterium]MDE2505046.1 SDR family oxidoreductase [Burkholderiales bacterium]
MHPGRLQAKTALITGAAGGIGAAIARRFAGEGARVVLSDRPDAGQVACAATLPQALALGLDVTSEDDWAAAMSFVRERCGRLDILVNNAGLVAPPAPIEARSVDDWERVMAVNARGVFLGTKHAIPLMRAGGGGAIVNISSLAAIGQSGIMDALYAASKGAVRIFTKVTAAQHAHEGIRCNSVHPGPIDSEMLRGVWSDPALIERRLSRIPMGRLGRSEEVAAAVLYLASDEAAYTTGVELAIDGGALVQ